MPNPGTFSGLSTTVGWKIFNPSRPILTAAASSGAVQPILGSSTVVAHYFYDQQVGNVVYQGYIQFDSTATFGTGDVYGVLLPVPAARVLGGADMPIGNGWAWQGSAGNRNIPLRATLMDPIAPYSNQTSEDYYAQFFTPYILATGTSAVTGSNTSVTITHTLGMTPVEFDISVVPTSQSTTNPGYWYITNCTSTQFTVNLQTAPSTNPFNFSWKARAEPNGTTVFDLLVNPLRPFGGGWVSGNLLGWNLEYQARR